ncbi:18347_t:CDS:2, partial [Gigaspora rosea]
MPNSEQEQNQEQTSFGLNGEPDKMFQTSELIFDQTSYVKQMSPDHIQKIGMVSTNSVQNQVSEITQMKPVSDVFHRELHSNVMESSSDIGAQNDQTRNRFYRFHPDDFASIRQTRACLPRKKSSMSKDVLTARKVIKILDAITHVNDKKLCAPLPSPPSSPPPPLSLKDNNDPQPSTNRECVSQPLMVNLFQMIANLLNMGLRTDTIFDLINSNEVTITDVFNCPTGQDYDKALCLFFSAANDYD